MLTRRHVLIAAAGASVVLPLAAGHGRIGTFQGVSGHVASGRAEIAGNTITLLDDIRFDGAPDPQVALGRDGFDPATLLAPLASNSGRQTYAVPAEIDTGAYNEVWIWCEQFDVPLAVARIG